MARLPRLVVPGLPHLVIQRGNDGQPIFRDEVDRRRFVQNLTDVARTNGLAVHAYVLMEDHVQLLATPAATDSLSRTMQSLGRRYVGAFNARHGRRGTLWEGRFRCAVIETERYLLDCMRFVELNPVRTGKVAGAGDYAWSSARGHLGQCQDQLLTDHPLFWALGNTPFEREVVWRSMLEQGMPEHQVARLSESALKGWACGGDAFLAALKNRIARPVAPRPRGRPVSR